jgi:hypothetical protein
MPQNQAFVEVRQGGQRIGTGIATGNNATWPCRCGRPEWLVGKTGDLAGKWDARVQCPDCAIEYFVFPIGKDKGAVDYVARL